MKNQYDNSLRQWLTAEGADDTERSEGALRGVFRRLADPAPSLGFADAVTAGPTAAAAPLDGPPLSSQRPSPLRAVGLGVTLAADLLGRCMGRPGAALAAPGPPWA